MNYENIIEEYQIKLLDDDNKLEELKAEHPNQTIAIPLSGTVQDAVMIKTVLQSYTNCERCGYCCQISNPVAVDGTEIRKIAKHLGISFSFMMRNHIKQNSKGGFSLKNLNPCEFLSSDGSGCTIFEIRPKVCRGYPFLNTFDKDDANRIVITLECKSSINAWRKFRSCINLTDRNSETQQIA